MSASSDPAFLVVDGRQVFLVTRDRVRAEQAARNVGGYVVQVPVVFDGAGADDPAVRVGE